MDYAQLRTLLEPLVTGLKDAGTHTMLPTLCEELGLPAPAADGSKRGTVGKHRHLRAASARRRT